MIKKIFQSVSLVFLSRKLVSNFLYYAGYTSGRMVCMMLQCSIVWYGSTVQQYIYMAKNDQIPGIGELFRDRYLSLEAHSCWPEHITQVCIVSASIWCKNLFQITLSHDERSMRKVHQIFNFRQLYTVYEQQQKLQNRGIFRLSEKKDRSWWTFWRLRTYALSTYMLI